MRPLLVGHNDGPSGAGRAVARLHSGLLEAGADSRLLVGHPSAGLVETIAPRGPLAKLAAKFRGHADQLPLRLYRKRTGSFFSTTFFSGDPTRLLSGSDDYDLVHLHWINGGFMHPAAFRRFRKPLVWTVHDSWAFTGGCHVPGDCRRYTENCGACPQLASRANHDLSRLVWNRKHRAFKSLKIALVTPSRWMADCIRSSKMFAGRDVEVIPNGIDTRIYRPFSKLEARERLGLPIKGEIVLFGAINATADRNKGYDLLEQAMAKLAADRLQSGKNASRKHPGLSLAVFGTNRDPRNVKKSHQSGFPLYELGSFSDDLALALAYSAADVMCVPSRQESFGQTAAEAMACETPVVAFGATGLLDIIDHQKNGYLARPYDSIDFAAGIEWTLKNKANLGSAARKKIETEFSPGDVARRHLELYSFLLT